LILAGRDEGESGDAAEAAESDFALYDIPAEDKSSPQELSEASAGTPANTKRVM